MTPYQWINRLKATCGIDSDYKAAQALGITRSALSNYKSGKRLTLDENVSLKLANLIGEKPEIVLLDQYAEQAKTPAIRAALARFCILCKVASECVAQQVCNHFDSNKRLLIKA